MNKLRILLLALAYACFWALFVLFPYPSNVVPESYTSYDAAPVFASTARARYDGPFRRGSRSAS